MTVSIRRGALGLAAAALLLPLGPARAAAPAALVLSSAAGSSHATVTFDKPVVVKRADWFAPLGWSGCGRFRGYFLQPVGAQKFRGTGMVDVARFGYGTALRRMPVRLGEQAQTGTYLVTIPAGRYRIHLLGEGRCEVRIPVVSGIAGTRRVTTRERTPVQYAEQDLGAPGVTPALKNAGLASFPLGITSRTYTVVTGHLYDRSTTAPPTGDVLPCIDVVPAATCGLTNDGVQAGVNSEQVNMPDGTSYTATDAYAFAFPGALPQGQQYGKVHFYDVSGPVSAVASVLVFEP
jgi:hypothetical protein